MQVCLHHDSEQVQSTRRRSSSDAGNPSAASEFATQGLRKIAIEYLSMKKALEAPEVQNDLELKRTGTSELTDARDQLEKALRRAFQAAVGELRLQGMLRALQRGAGD